MLARLAAVPTNAARQVDRYLRGAVGNARHAAAALATTNDHRRDLTPLEPDGDAVHGDLVRLSHEQCLNLLRSRSVGRFAYVASARALDVVPVNYVAGEDGSIVFRTGPGPKLSSAERKDVVAFEVDDIDEQSHTGWSVLVTGRARRLTEHEPAVVDKPEPWAQGPRHATVVITPTRIEGRRLV